MIMSILLIGIFYRSSLLSVVHLDNHQHHKNMIFVWLLSEYCSFPFSVRMSSGYYQDYLKFEGDDDDKNVDDIIIIITMTIIVLMIMMMIMVMIITMMMIIILVERPAIAHTF